MKTRQLGKNNLTVSAASSGDVSAVSDRVLALNYGRPLAIGKPAEVQSHPEVMRAYLGG